MFSQHDEELAIVAHFAASLDCSKRFLDIGAADGRTFSNTHQLALYGWSGTLIEPSSFMFTRLMDLYRNRPDLNLVNAAVGDYDGMLRFHESRDFVSTSIESHRELWDGAKSHVPEVGKIDYQTCHVGTFTLDRLLNLFPGPYSMVNVDVEGANFGVFSSLLRFVDELGTELVCVEFENRWSEMVNVAALKGFKVAHKTTENIVFTRPVVLYRGELVAD